MTNRLTGKTVAQLARSKIPVRSPQLDHIGLAIVVQRRSWPQPAVELRHAKYTLSLRMISLACRSARISRSSALIRLHSSVVGPTRMPQSRSAFLTP